MGVFWEFNVDGGLQIVAMGGLLASAESCSRLSSHETNGEPAHIRG